MSFIFFGVLGSIPSLKGKVKERENIEAVNTVEIAITPSERLAALKIETPKGQTANRGRGIM